MLKPLQFDKVIVDTDYKVAIDSPDHIAPCGTAKDNSINLRFNRKIYRLYGTEGVGLRVLDLGCSGGGFVKSLLDGGALAVGIEGSDFSLKYSRANWPFLGNKMLFTADITKPFQISLEKVFAKEPIKFHVITMWEVLEHLKETDLQFCLQNVRNHLLENGLFIVSVSPDECPYDGIALHQTIKNGDWWLEVFKNSGFIRRKDIEGFLNGQYIRGPKQFAKSSLNFVFCINSVISPKTPRHSVKEKILDRWFYSRPHLILSKLFSPAGA